MLYLYHLVLSWQRPSCQRARTAATCVYIPHPAVIVLIRAVAKSTAFASLAGRSKPSSLFGRFRCILWRCVCPCIDSSAAPALFSQRAGLDRAGQPGLGSQHRLLQSRLPRSCKLMPAVKANAYGHGAVPVCERAISLGRASFLRRQP